MISIGVCIGINYGLGEKGKEVAPVVKVRLRDGWHGEPGCDGSPLWLEGSEDVGLFEF